MFGVRFSLLLQCSDTETCLKCTSILKDRVAGSVFQHVVLSDDTNIDTQLCFYEKTEEDFEEKRPKMNSWEYSESHELFLDQEKVQSAIAHWITSQFYPIYESGFKSNVRLTFLVELLLEDCVMSVSLQNILVNACSMINAEIMIVGEEHYTE